MGRKSKANGGVVADDQEEEEKYEQNDTQNQYVAPPQKETVKPA
jgi:hypothetical protein